MRREHNKPTAIALVTDFGNDGLYIGQMEITLVSSGLPVVNLLSNAPAFNPQATAYLLSAIAQYQPAGLLYLSVVDPGVGGERLPLVIDTGRDWFIGPDNGLFSQVIRQATSPVISVIEPVKEPKSVSFHGRDLFAPAAVSLCKGESIKGQQKDASELVGTDWPDKLNQIIYIDHFGNLITGLPAVTIPKACVMEIANTEIRYARTFSEVEVDQLFWYENSIGLVEIASNCNRAADLLSASVGDTVLISGA